MTVVERTPSSSTLPRPDRVGAPPPTSSTPPGLRPVGVAVAAAVLLGVVVAVLTAVQHRAVLDFQQAADPSTTRSGLESALWSRVGAAGAAAAIWPVLLRRLRRGRATAYARMRLASVVVAVVLVAVLVSGAAPVWLHVLQGAQAAGQLAVFATLMRPDVKGWYDARRPAGQPVGAWRPALFLLLAAPFVAEVSIGDIPFSGTGLLAAVVVLPIYVGALLIRELVRRAGRGWGAVAALGAVFMLVEEGLALQSVFSPTIYDGAGPAWGARWFGVNGVYSEVQLVNHVVWSVGVPILLAELAFPAHRRQPWLRRPVLVLAGLVYVAGVGLLLLTARTTLTPGYWAPTPLLIGTGVLTVALTIGAFTVHRRRPTTDVATSGRRPPTPAAVGTAAAVTGFAVLAGLVWPGHFGAAYPRTAVIAVPMVTALVVVVAAVAAVRRAVRTGGWTDRHTTWLCGGLLVGHVACWGVTQPGGTVDRVVVAVLLVATVTWLTGMARRRRRPAT